jgi:lipid-binding SYLF domain-containing protein
MAGITVFASIADALRAGFVVYDRTEDGYVVRRHTANGWEQALVVFTDRTPRQ